MYSTSEQSYSEFACELVIKNGINKRADSQKDTKKGRVGGSEK